MGEGAARLWEAHQDQNILQLQNVEGILCVEEERACQVFIHSLSFIYIHYGEYSVTHIRLGEGRDFLDG